jgi:hypothetical protein
MKKIQITNMATLFLVATLLSGFPAFGQEKSADNMQIVREKLRADKKLFVAEVMQLTDGESKGFWPVYERYQQEYSKVNDRVLQLIKEYASHYGSMTNEAARKLVNDSLTVEADRQKIRQSYLPKFRQVLSEVKVARFYQLENKIQAAVNYDLAAGIPLVE